MEIVTLINKPVRELVKGDQILDCFEQIFTVQELDYLHSDLFDLSVKLITHTKKPSVWFKELHGNKQMKVIVKQKERQNA